MPQPRKPRKANDLKPDAGAPAPGEVPSTHILEGILGESTAAGSVRLFLDAGFTRYYDIPADAVERREQVPAARSPLGVDSSILWVRRGTELVLHRSETRRVEDEFLAGDFTIPGSFVPSTHPGSHPVEWRVTGGTGCHRTDLPPCTVPGRCPLALMPRTAPGECETVRPGPRTRHPCPI